MPYDLKAVWINNFEMIQEIGQIRFNRAIVPVDAIDSKIDMIDTADASHFLICSDIYARFKRKNGEYSCQLIFSRSKILQEDITMPRAEMSAAVLNARTGFVVQRSLGNKFNKCVKLTDSQIVLHWITNEKLSLLPWVKNVKSAGMIADLGTKQGAKIADIEEDSYWINGFPWMKLREEEFPLKTVEDLTLNKEERTQHDKEGSELKMPMIWDHEIYSANLTSNTIDVLSLATDLGERYNFSNYVLDPNKFRLRKVIRILAIVIAFICKLKKKLGKKLQISNSCPIPSSFMFTHDKYLVTEGKGNGQKDPKFKCRNGLVISLTDVDLERALTYYYRKATDEVKRFVNPKVYRNISREKDGILYYTARILPSQIFNEQLNLSDVTLDLTSTHFCVPLKDSGSPFA